MTSQSFNPNIMKVFRLEDEVGIGPYYSDLLEEVCESYEWYSKMLEHHKDFQHPNAWEDRLYNLTKEHKFAFDSLDKLHQWFEGYLDNLLEVGFSIKEYNTEDYEIGISGKQLIFVA